MDNSGHVFVVQGSLPDVVCDLALIPTDSRLSVRETWGRFSPRSPDGPRADEVAASRMALSRGLRVGELIQSPSRPAFRYVDVGLPNSGRLEGKDLERAVVWLEEGITKALRLITEDVKAGLSSTRERPLVSLPALGTAGGGFGAVRGRVARQLLHLCEKAVGDGMFDIVIVCLHRSDFAFLQSQRTAVGTHDLSHREREKAQVLGKSAAASTLSLFLGAGVSIAAGLPGFAAMVTRMSQQLREPHAPQTAQEAAVAAGLLRKRFTPQEVKEAAAPALEAPGASLLHSILASTRAAEVMTTNFDELFELSARSTYSPQQPDVLPWERRRRRPWLLKMHGSLRRSGDLIITEAQLQELGASRKPLESVLQAQLLTRDVLFVGYSLQDPNVVTLAREVRQFLESTEQEVKSVGTILTLEPLGQQAEALDDALDVIDLGRGDAMPTAARRLEIFCDLLLWYCTRHEPAWQLDERYRNEGRNPQLREDLRRIDVPADGAWQQLHDLLKAYGLNDRHHP